MIFLILLTFFVALIALYVYDEKRKLKKFEHIPGPTPLPFIGNALEIGTNTTDHLKNLQRLAQKYGGVVRLSMGRQNFVLLTDPQYIAQALIAGGSYYKGDLYKIMDSLLGNGLLTSSGDKWVKDRKLLNMAFGNKQLENYCVVFNDVADKIVNQLKKLSHNEYVDITDPIFTYTLYTSCKTAMEVDITENNEYHRHLDELTDLFFKRFLSPFKMSNFLYRFTNDYRNTKKYSTLIDNFVRSVITKRKEEFTTKTDDPHTPSILKEIFKASENSLSDKELVDQAKTFVASGSDTVGVTLSFAMYELAKQPKLQAKIVEELDAVLSGNLTGEINHEELNQLKYTECVIKEAIRLYAPVVFVTRTLPNKMNFDDISVPANSVAIAFIYGLHKSEKIYPNPDKFDPDRFLPENSADRHPYSYIPFAIGARACIGQKFAMLEAKVKLAKIVRNFEMMEHPNHEPVLVAAGTLKSINGLPIKLKPRITSTM